MLVESSKCVGKKHQITINTAYVTSLVGMTTGLKYISGLRASELQNRHRLRTHKRTHASRSVFIPLKGDRMRYDLKRNVSITSRRHSQDVMTTTRLAIGCAFDQSDADFCKCKKCCEN